MVTLIAPLLFIAAIIYVAYPLLSDREEEQFAGAEDGTAPLLQEKEELVMALRDVEMDYRMGKLSLQDYNQLRSDLERRVVGTLKELEKVSSPKRGEP